MVQKVDRTFNKNKERKKTELVHQICTYYKLTNNIIILTFL